MSRIAYRDGRMQKRSEALVAQTNAIIAEYTRQGYTLTLRQVYYQLVSRAIIPNSDKSYKSLGNIIADARYYGMIDWNAIEDRTRNLAGLRTYATPQDAFREAQERYYTDFWKKQPYYPEVWVEKEALAGVIGQGATNHRVNYIACRGYMSASEMHAAAMRFVSKSRRGQIPIIYHFGDHDPSGIDMSRDIADRINEFCQHWGVFNFEFERLALNIDQVKKYDPPPNPAKLSDSRSDSYVRIYGDSSWELDALEPKVMDDLITAAIDGIRDEDAWAASQAKEDADKQFMLDYIDQMDSEYV